MSRIKLSHAGSGHSVRKYIWLSYVVSDCMYDVEIADDSMSYFTHNDDAAVVNFFHSRVWGL